MALQWAAWEKQQKELARQEEIVARLSAGGQAGRATSAEKFIEKLKSEGELVEKPFVPKRRSFRFPTVETMVRRRATALCAAVLPDCSMTAHSTTLAGLSAAGRASEAVSCGGVCPSMPLHSLEKHPFKVDTRSEGSAATALCRSRTCFTAPSSGAH